MSDFINGDGVTWLNRTMVQGPNMVLVMSQDAFIKVLDHLKIPYHERAKWNSGLACVYYYEAPHGGRCAVVCMDREKLADYTSVEIACLLVHEAVHIFQFWRDYAGERTASNEFEAYAIQNISQTLMESYVNQTKA